VTKTINLTLKVWRQNGPKDKGRFDTYHAENISTDMSFLEMLDVVNDQLTIDDKEPIAFDHDCREGICGMCGCVVNGRAHGAEKGTTFASCTCAILTTATPSPSSPSGPWPSR
jgi:succinate dehydrogenase / fumarate reductase iron-sulfur subunit